MAPTSNALRFVIIGGGPAGLAAAQQLARAGHEVQVLFLDASDESLTRRYSETRRRHPLAGRGTVAEGLANERAVLKGGTP